MRHNRKALHECPSSYLTTQGENLKLPLQGARISKGHQIEHYQTLRLQTSTNRKGTISNDIHVAEMLT